MEHILDCRLGWDPADLAFVSERIANGDLVVLPTDTVYGIGVRADNHDSVRALLAAKGRNETMPPPVLLASVEQAYEVSTDLSADAIRLMESFWPGALTVIVKANPRVAWDLGQTGGTVALRMPAHEAVCELLGTVGPMAVTSANLTGQPPATNVEEARGYFGGTVNCYVDSGPTKSAIPSTIIDCAHGKATLLREGAWALKDIATVLGYQPTTC